LNKKPIEPNWRDDRKEEKCPDGSVQLEERGETIFKKRTAKERGRERPDIRLPKRRGKKFYPQGWEKKTPNLNRCKDPEVPAGKKGHFSVVQKLTTSDGVWGKKEGRNAT